MNKYTLEIMDFDKNGEVKLITKLTTKKVTGPRAKELFSDYLKKLYGKKKGYAYIVRKVGDDQILGMKDLK